MVCQSTAEAEFVAANEACKHVVWLRELLRELGFPPSAPSVIHEDNEACIKMVTNHVVSGRNRHFCTKMAWLRNLVSTGVVIFAYVPSKRNVADILTKVLPRDHFLRLAAALVSSSPAIRPLKKP